MRQRKFNLFNKIHYYKMLARLKKKIVISLTFLLHSLGLLVAFFKTQNNLPFHLSFHLLRFFTWWSVHSSILAILAIVAII